MKTIRGKLLVYFFAFFILFQITAISIFVSSNQLTNTYHDSFERFLLLNSISQQSDELYAFSKTFTSGEREPDQIEEYHSLKNEFLANKKRLENVVSDEDQIELKNYFNILETFIHETELTVGFVLLNDIEQYTSHLEETRSASRYIQESTLELLDVELTAYQSFYNDLQKRNEYFFIFIFFLFITTIMIAVFFALWFSRGITRPIHEMSAAAKEVSRGDFQGEALDIQSNDELKLLGDTFDNMRTNIHDLVKEIKDQSELDQLLKDMEIKHLQNQINPHFLFNTLNTMSKMAYLEDAQSTSSLIESVAKLLRHSLGKIDKSVTLQDEVGIVKDYFHIQKTRFSERIKVVFGVDDSTLNTEIPRLTLQPLVENAFIHGVEDREEGGEISVRIYKTMHLVIVEVSDDGVGMAQETVEQILNLSDREEEHVGHSTGIGLTNVIKRLQIFYQVQDIVQIDSEPGKGTTVRLLLPETYEGGDSDAGFDRGR